MKMVWEGEDSKEQMPFISVFRQMVHICEKSLSSYLELLEKYENPAIINMLKMINIQ